jgi:arsenite-transporting ATPase
VVLTIDPAWRLRQALGLRADSAEQRVALHPPASGELWAAMLDVRATLDEAVRTYGDRGIQQRVLDHPIYGTIADSLAGMQELMAVERIHQLARHGFDNIVVDTAPSRHAFEFLDKPSSFAELAGSNWVRLIGRTYKLVEATGLLTLGRATMEVYRRVESILGAALVSQVLDFYSVFVSIAEGYSDRARSTTAMMRDPAVTDFRAVSVPGKALRDARFFAEGLAERKLPTGPFYVNRVWQLDPGGAAVGGVAGDVLAWYEGVRASQREAVAGVQAEFGGRFPGIVTLPELDQDVAGIGELESMAMLTGV